MTFADMSQIGIAFFGVTAIFLSQRSQAKHLRWAPVFGLAGQPFWFYTTFEAQQWGIFMLSFLYTLAWLSGLRRHWSTQ